VVVLLLAVASAFVGCLDSDAASEDDVAAIEYRLDEISARLEALETPENRLDEISARLEALETPENRLDEISARLEALETPENREPPRIVEFRSGGPLGEVDSQDVGVAATLWEYCIGHSGPGGQVNDCKLAYTALDADLPVAVRERSDAIVRCWDDASLGSPLPECW
jgi:hypothetical protein